MLIHMAAVVVISVCLKRNQMNFADAAMRQVFQQLSRRCSIMAVVS